MGISKQSLLGALLLLVGGGILAFAMMQQPEKSNQQLANGTTNGTTETVDGNSPDNGNLNGSDLGASDLQVMNIDGTGNNSSNGNPIKPTALTTDIETESQILDKKQQQREAQVKAQETEALNFLKQKEEAAANALAKAREENEAFRENRNQNTNNYGSASSGRSVSSTPKSADRYESEADFLKSSPKAPTATKQNSFNGQRPQNYTVRKGESFSKISQRFGVPILALAEANGMTTNDTLFSGQNLRVPSKSEEANLVRSAKNRAKKQQQAATKRKAKIQAERQAKRDAKRKAETAKKNKIAADRKRRADEKRKEQEQAIRVKETKRNVNQKLVEARSQVKREDIKGTFGVQVALASNQEKADEIAALFRKAGYKVKTSKTTRGVRVMVGPERGKIAAIALKNKINNDSKVNVNDAWVLYWR